MAEGKGGVSRRGFLKGFGTGVVGAAVAAKVRLGEAAPQTSPGWDGKVPVVLRVNGKEYRLLLEPRTTLVRAIREHLGLTGTKVVCDRGECGGCTVLMDNKPVYSCQVLAVEAQGHEITTIEGLVQAEELDPIQKAFVEHDAMQCGFCTPGQIMAAKGLLLKNPSPTREEILRGMSGNLCRCAAYPGILRAVESLAKKAQG
jgi:xanthine dehydrogenase YagT iron-sulfur-binding subunit